METQPGDVLDAFELMLTEGGETAFPAALLEPAWAVEEAGPDGVRLRHGNGSWVDVSRRDGFPEAMFSSTTGVQWRSVLPSVSRAEWAARISGACASDRQSLRPEALLHAKDLLLVQLVFDCAVRHPEYWKEPYVLDCLLSAAVKSLLVGSEFRDLGRALAGKAPEAEERARSAFVAAGKSEGEAARLAKEILAEGFEEGWKESSAEFEQGLRRALLKAARRLGAGAEAVQGMMDYAADVIVDRHHLEVERAIRMYLGGSLPSAHK